MNDEILLYVFRSKIFHSYGHATLGLCSAITSKLFGCDVSKKYYQIVIRYTSFCVNKSFTFREDQGIICKKGSQYPLACRKRRQNGNGPTVDISQIKTSCHRSKYKTRKRDKWLSFEANF